MNGMNPIECNANNLQRIYSFERLQRPRTEQMATFFILFFCECKTCNKWTIEASRTSTGAKKWKNKTKMNIRF